jgi:hypothetical protein
MKHQIMIIGVALIWWPACILRAETVPSARATPRPWRGTWQQTDTSLTLLNDGHVLWRFNHDKAEGKPYFHPLCLMNGTELTWLRPPDHVWHRAMWFSWKFINGLNYWEPNPATGLCQGRTEIATVNVTPSEDFSARLELTLVYRPPGRPAVLTESRVIEVSTPDAKGHYRIDWHSTFTASDEAVLLDRTPIPGEEGGQSWGGYAGLSIRLGKSLKDFQIRDSEGHRNMGVHGQNARWVDYCGTAATGQVAGLALFDHPDNLRYPTPWYIMRDERTPAAYVGPAVLFNEPYSLPARGRLTLKYRVLVHAGPIATSALEAEWADYAR